ncbi:MAG: hypothetical protein WDO16_13740 [Bacteroidota bacterium]
MVQNNESCRHKDHQQYTGIKSTCQSSAGEKGRNKQWKYYSFLSTGNLNEATGRFYTDHVFFTANTVFSTELQWLFEYLQVRKQPDEYDKIPFTHLLVSQFNMVKRFTELINREIRNAREGKPAGIIIN